MEENSFEMSCNNLSMNDQYFFQLFLTSNTEKGKEKKCEKILFSNMKMEVKTHLLMKLIHYEFIFWQAGQV